jgi:hypothetical protein
MKRFLVTVVAVGLSIVGTAGAAAAQDTGTGSSSPSTQPAGNHAATPHRGQRRGAAILQVTAKTLGVKPRDLVAALCGGQTIAQIASQHGKSTQDVITALVTAADHRIDQAVAAGRLDPTRAATRKGQVEATVTARVKDFKPNSQRCQKLQGLGTGSATPTST